MKRKEDREGLAFTIRRFKQPAPRRPRLGLSLTPGTCIFLPRACEGTAEFEFLTHILSQIPKARCLGFRNGKFLRALPKARGKDQGLCKTAGNRLRF